ncbi:MAG: tetraprenyl-beta-curcumene synthase family protein [Zhaonellaceae bacterium]
MLKTFYQLKLIANFITKVFPLVDDCLAAWKTSLEYCPDENLKRQALASLKHKRFHAQGGSIYALYPGVPKDNLVDFIVALQTISDYLDNLCDRAGCFDLKAFDKLHISMFDALGITASKHIPSVNYYALYPYREDGGYLLNLVLACRNQLAKFPNYPLVEKQALELVQLYSALQAYKHTYKEEREKLLADWIRPKLTNFPELSVWEFAAATGSTLGIFMLVAASSLTTLTVQDVAHITRAYFPWICSLHIMLDYFIDQEEDKAEADFNFVSFYKDEEECCRRLVFLWQKAKEMVLTLPNSSFHLTVIEGLLALYLSDPKALQKDNYRVTKALLQEAGSKVRKLHSLCILLRKKTII